MTDHTRTQIRAAILENEEDALARLIATVDLQRDARIRISERAAGLIRDVRGSSTPGMMESFLAEFGLSTKEGVALMCLAEALLRVPDAETIDELIQDKIVPHNWGAHVGDSGSMLVNASTWALMLTGRVLDEEVEDGIVGSLRGAIRRLGEPVIRTAVGRAMREMGAQFVLGRGIREAMKRGTAMVERGYTYSYDMLGEAARTEQDAARYHGAYAHAIAAIAVRAKSADIRENPGISVKLSALHPRYEFSQRDTMLPEMSARALQLAQAAKAANIGLNIDAEEADRLDMSLDVIEEVLSDPSLAGWDGFGVVVQAYTQRCAHVIDWLHALAERLERRIMVRLVKGAYWDTEIKRAQVLGLDGFPVFTRKPNTDVSYIACASKLLSMRERLYPQFATHNAHTAAAIIELAGNDRDSFEFQRLHGMGEALHDVVKQSEGTRCRIYAPVGAHRDLLAYLVRRLLENGANSSFVNQIVDEDVSPETIARDPFELSDGTTNPVVAHPSAIFKGRRNAKGWDITDPVEIARIETGRAEFAQKQWQAGIAGFSAPRSILNPSDPSDTVGAVHEAAPEQVRTELDIALAAATTWEATPVEERATILRRAADLYEAHSHEFFALTAREAGKTLLDAVNELREAVDFLRYYANQAKAAERELEARGAIVCISPWNFPLAIFTGQIAAALVTGNVVLAKPAEQTPLIAARAIELLYEAGVPENALRPVYGAGDVGASLVADSRISGVCFTGSTDVAKTIDRQLAQSAPDAMLIAETGGLNAMIVDSTALLEQAVGDIVASAFQSAGQRCSALRILYVQRDVEERLLEMLFGAMDSLSIGDPWALSTDVGPVINDQARAGILSYLAQAEGRGRMLKQLDTPMSDGHFVPPTVIRVNGINEMPREIFGPVLHVARFGSDDLSAVVDTINARGYGLTFGLHTRIDQRVQDIVDQAKVGNFYVNRNQIGAVVGSQPFGGEGLSGTGPKAGGPHYLRKFRVAKRPTPQSNPVLPTPTITQETLAAANVTTAQIDAAFDQLDASAWAARQDRISILRGALRGQSGKAMSAAAALEMGPVDLPGPTGESNRLTLAPRGRVLCLGPSPEAALAQAIQALRCGNSVLVVCPDTADVLEDLIAAELPIAVLSGTVTASSLGEVHIDAVAYSVSIQGWSTGSVLTGGSRTSDSERPLQLQSTTLYVGADVEFRQALAAREDALIPLITAILAPSDYAHERALCIDTTAAGGNATLLAKAG